MYLFFVISASFRCVALHWNRTGFLSSSASSIRFRRGVSYPVHASVGRIYDDISGAGITPIAPIFKLNANLADAPTALCKFKQPAGLEFKSQGILAVLYDP